MALAMGAMSATSSRALAVSYATNVTKTGTTVNFILNSPADILSYSINGGAPILLDGTTKGAKTFNLTSAGDTFSIVADRTDAAGFTIPTGGAPIPGGGNALFTESPEAGLTTLSDDTSVLNRFSNPRGVSVSMNPNAPNFGTAYVANSAGTVTPGTQTIPASGIYPTRTVTGSGLYALRSDGADAYGYGDAAKNPLIDGFATWLDSSNNSPFRNYVAQDGSIYVADFSDANGSVVQVTPDLNTAINVLPGFGGNPTLPIDANHGSTTAVHVEGSLAGGDLKVYTIDEDLTSAQFGGASTTDQNSLWEYNIGSGPFPSAVIPTKIAEPLIPLATTDMQRGADGKWYLMQVRNGALNSPTLFVVSEDGSTVLFNSLEATRTLTANPTADRDILQYCNGVAVSPDQKWIAMILNIGDVAVMPLIDGIPDLANKMVVNTDPSVISGRDIAFDAAGNIHYVSSGQALYRVLAPGGHSVATTTWNGTEYVFGVVTVPGGGGLDGDFNDDDVVDGADFLVWQRGGSPNPLSAGDLNLWKTNFGQTAATSAVGSVPEPASLGLAVMGIAALAAARRRR
ncbi:MAG: hypothetical protein C0485_04720 [Pirellula sp.]|nr:hypothetical protein [Pirellula sp.]